MTFLQSPIVNQKTISQKETMLNPRQRPKSPPRLAMKSKIVILLEISYSAERFVETIVMLNF